MNHNYTRRNIKTFINRYQQLIRVIESLSDHEAEKHIDMLNWEANTECGTVRCVAGWAGRDPWFRKAGFRLQTRVPVYRGTCWWRAIDEFFGQSSRNTTLVHPVFGADAYPTRSPSRQEIIRAIVREINWLKSLTPVLAPKRKRRPLAGGSGAGGSGGSASNG